MTAIDGMPGVGKTALAVHWAHRVRHVVWFGLRPRDGGDRVAVVPAAREIDKEFAVSPD